MRTGRRWLRRLRALLDECVTSRNRKYVKIIRQNIVDIEKEMGGSMFDGRCFAAYDYTAERDDELSLAINDSVVVTERQKCGERLWWWARHTATDQEGMISLYSFKVYHHHSMITQVLCQ